MKPIISSTSINKSLLWPPVVTIDGYFNSFNLFYKYVSPQSTDIKHCSGKQERFDLMCIEKEQTYKSISYFWLSKTDRKAT